MPSITLTRADELCKQRRTLAALFAARNEPVPPACFWRPDELQKAFLEEDIESVMLCSANIAAIFVVMGTNRAQLDIALALYEAAPPPRPSTLILVLDCDVPAYISRAIEVWRTTAEEVKSLQTFREGQLFYNPLEREDGPLHWRVVDDEVAALASVCATTKDQLLEMNAADPIAEFLGLVPGQIVEFERVSETAGTCRAMRVVGVSVRDEVF